MTESNGYTIDAERLLTSARAWGAAFPQFADLVARIEARLDQIAWCNDGAHMATKGLKSHHN